MNAAGDIGRYNTRKIASFSAGGKRRVTARITFVGFPFKQSPFCRRPRTRIVQSPAVFPATESKERVAAVASILRSKRGRYHTYGITANKMYVITVAQGTPSMP